MIHARTNIRLVLCHRAFFLGAGPLYSRETASRNFRGFYPPHFPYMQMNLDTCAMTATRSVEHLWRARSNRGGVGADHNSLIVFQIRDNRRSAPAIGNLLSHVCANISLFVILIA